MKAGYTAAAARPRPGLGVSLAFPAREGFSKVRVAARLGYNPGADGPRGIVAHVLAVATLEIGDPIAEIVLVESHDLAHRQEWIWHFDQRAKGLYSMAHRASRRGCRWGTAVQLE
jgi:hypothetical protein